MYKYSSGWGNGFPIIEKIDTMTENIETLRNILILEIMRQIAK